MLQNPATAPEGDVAVACQKLTLDFQIEKKSPGFSRAGPVGIWRGFRGSHWFRGKVIAFRWAAAV